MVQFICQKQDLCSGIAHVLRGVSAKSTIPALEGICVQMMEGTVVLTGYDLEIGIRTRIPAQCSEPYTCVMNARLFSEMSKRMPGDEIRFLHGRMPLIMPEKLVNEWIRPDRKPEELLPYALTEMVFEKTG